MRLTATLLATALLAGCGSGISLDEPIEGPIWRLERLGDQPIAPGANPQQDAQLLFDRNTGRVSGSGGCNRVTGSFTRSGATLRMSQLAATRMACLDPVVTANETQFFAVLQSTVGYRLQGPARLSLMDANGRTLAVLSAR